MIKIFNDYIKKQSYLFLRDTQDPISDIKRGFSCNVNSWFDTLEDALFYKNKHGALGNPKEDPISKKWCADPELGLSGFGFYDEKSFNEAISKIKNYNQSGKIALFIASEYYLDSGLDGEDVFVPNKFLKFITLDTKYNEL